MEGLDLRGHLPIGVEASRQPIVRPAVGHCSRRRVVVGSRHHGGAPAGCRCSGSRSC